MVSAAYDKVFGDHGATSGLRVVWEPICMWSNRAEMSPVDLRGGVFRANTRETADMIGALGGVAEIISITDAYQAIQRNAIQGFSGSTVSVQTFRLNEVLRSGIITNTQYSTGTFLVRQAALDSLPDELRTIYDEEMAATQKEVNELTVVSEARSRVWAEESGLNVRDVTDDEYTQLREAAERAVWSRWKERVGPEGDKALQEVFTAIEAWA